MSEIERLLRSNPTNFRRLDRLRDAVGAELEHSPFDRRDPPAATIEGAVYAFLDAARLWHCSPRLVSLVTELETLARSFRPNGRIIRGLRQLSPEAISALLDEAPGGPAVAVPVALAGGHVAGIGVPREAIAMLTDRPPENARLLGRLRANGPAFDPIDGVAIFSLPAPDRTRLRDLFSDPLAPGRGDLGVLKKRLDAVDQARIAAGAARAAANLKSAFRIWDKRTDHKRGSTAAAFLAPAPLARLALDVADLVLPRDEPFLFLGRQLGTGRRDDEGPKHADQVRYIFAETLETARRIAAETDDLRDIDLFCGMAITRRVSDLITRSKKEAASDDLIDADFDHPTTAAGRLIENVMAARDTVLSLRAYEATFLTYTDRVLDLDPPDDLRAARNWIVRDVCGALQRRYRLAKAELDDGVFYWAEKRPRATGSARRREWLSSAIARVPIELIATPWVPVSARPARTAAFDAIVADIATEIEISAKATGGLQLSGDRPLRHGPSLRTAWAALRIAYPPRNILAQTTARRP